MIAKPQRPADFLVVTNCNRAVDRLRAKVAELEAERDRAIDERNRVWELEKADNMEQLIVDNEALKQRIAELEAAIRVDLDDVDSNCGSDRCAPYLSRHRRCPDCPIEWVTTIRKALEKSE